MSGVEGSGRAEARFSTLLLNLALKRRSSTAVISKIKIVGQECPTHTGIADFELMHTGRVGC
jgi:hypothetical protein